MSSVNKTPNLNLPQWAANEKPERTDFNSAFDAIDDTIGKFRYQSIGVSKDVQTEGTDFVPTLGLPKRIDVHLIYSVGGRQSVFTWLPDTTSSAIVTVLSLGYLYTNSGFGHMCILENNVGSVKNTGTISNVTASGFSVTWEKNGPFSLTGNCIIRFVVQY